MKSLLALVGLVWMAVSTVPAFAGQGVLDRIAALGEVIGLNDGQQEFLDPDIAFIPSASVQDGDVVVRWDIADGYYLYRDKFAIRVPADATVGIGEAQFPPGKVKDDEFFGRIEVFYHEVEGRAPITRIDEGISETLVTVTYQGCADAGLCYPVQTKMIPILLDGPVVAAGIVPATISISAAAGTVAPPPVTQADGGALEAALSGGSVWLVITIFFAAGLLLAFTACMYPMIPILSSIIVGQGETITTGRAFVLSLIYVEAVALTYAALGLASAQLGAGVQAAFQNPWVLGSFATMFVLLALSMFGFYQLQLPASWQGKLAEFSNRQRGGSFVGVAIMGVLSALIVGPCAGPVVIAALAYSAQTGDIAMGSTALFAMGNGLGAPLLVIGTFGGALLPKAGGWMDAVKAVFGVILIGVAILLLERIVPGPVALALWALLLIVAAIYMGALEPIAAGVSGWRKLWKGLGVAMIIYGIVLIIGATTGGRDVFRPLHNMGGLSGAGGEAVIAAKLPFVRIKSVADFDRAAQRASAEGQQVMLDFYADWCTYCIVMEDYTFSDPAVQAALSGVVLLQADVTKNDPIDKALMNHFGLFAPPAILFFDKSGSEIRQVRVVGLQDAEKFLATLENAIES